MGLAGNVRGAADRHASEQRSARLAL